MYTKTFSLIVLVICTLAVFGVPNVTLASDVFFKVVSGDVQVDAPTIIELRINPEGKNLNAVEGTILLSEESSNAISKVTIETGGSVLGLWAEVPTYSVEEKTIRFSGGSFSGFNEEGLLFRIRITASKAGIAKLSLLRGSAYLNDGLGTEDTISARSITVALAPSNPSQLQSASVDTSPPKFDSVVVSRDESVYDGKYFVSFHATDDISGISHYVVTENEISNETTEGVYVLQNQDRDTRVVIVAYDNAGNSRAVRVPTPFEWLMQATLLAVSLLALIAFLAYRLRYYKKAFKR